MGYVKHQTINCFVPGDTTAAETKNIYLCRAPAAAAGIECSIVATEDVTENDTDYVVLQLCSATGAASTLTGMMTAVNTQVTGGIDLNEGVAVDFSLTTATLAAGSYLVLKLTKGGAGKALPPCLVTVEWDLTN